MIEYGTMRQIEIAQEECYCPVDVTVIPGAGHSPHREAPGATLDAISEFAKAVLHATKARRGGPRDAFSWCVLRLAIAPMTHPVLSRSDLPLPRWAYVPGETAEADADQDTLSQVKAWCRRDFRDYVPARHPALRYGIALNDRGYFWEVAGGPGSGVGGGAARRPRADPAARLHPDRDRESAAAHAEAPCRGAAVRRGARRTQARSACAAPRGDGFADGFPIAALAALIKAKLERPLLAKADWVAFGAVEPNMKQNACSGVLG